MLEKCQIGKKCYTSVGQSKVNLFLSIEFLPHGKTVNKEYFLSVKRRLREPIRTKRPELWYNVPASISLVLRDHFAYVFVGLIPKVKRPLRVRRFQSIEGIKKNRKSRWWLYRKDYLAYFEDWKNRWRKCTIGWGLLSKG